MTRYRGKHRTQYDGSTYANQNCTCASGANGARCATGGRVDKSGADIRNLVKRTEETNPVSPGWSIQDLKLAMDRLKIPFEIRKGYWSLVVKVLDSGRGVALQGDSDRFADNTCSGAFDGAHAVYVHPDKNGTKRLLGDPICRDWRWEEESVLRAYAQKLWGTTLTFGVFLDVVPEVPDDVGLKVYLEATKNLPWSSFGTAVLKSGPILRVSDGANISLNAGVGLGTVQKGTWDGKAIVAFNHAGETHIVEQAKTTFTALQPPSGGEDCTDKVTAAYTEGKQAGINEANAACAPKVTAAKAAGIQEGIDTAKRTVKTRHTVEAYWD